MPTIRYPRQAEDILHVVLDDATVERLQVAAMSRGIEVEQLIVQVIHVASWRLDELFARSDRGDIPYE